MAETKLLSTFEPYSSSSSASALFLSFEGIEGSGKTTQIQNLKESLETKGYQVEVFREPGGTIFGERLREAILNSSEKISPLAEACLFASSRAQLLSEKILPLLDQSKTVVIVDRYLDSSLAYQGVARGLGLETVLKLHQTFPLNIVPHASVYLRIDMQTSFARQSQRGSKKDYFERENREFYQKLIQGYDQASEMFSSRFIVVDGKGSPESIKTLVLEEVLNRLPKSGGE